MFNVLLVIPFTIVAILLLYIKNPKYLFPIAIVPSLLSFFYLISYTINMRYTHIAYISNFIYSDYSMLLLFMCVFITGSIFFLSQKSIDFKEYAFILIYFVGAVGAVIADNFFDLIIYWEILSLFGSLTIAMYHKKDNNYVAIKYFIIHSISGILLICGALEYISVFGTSDYPTSSLNPYDFGNMLILAGLLINLAIPPFSTWLTDAYTTSSPNSAIFLSVFTTKTAVLILLKLFHNNDILIYIGLFIASYGLIFSLFQQSLRSILAFSIIHQLGIVIVGIGNINFVGGIIVGYITVSVLYKTVLFMLAAILIKVYHTDNIYKLRNSINVKSLMAILIILSSCQSLGIPLTGGFVVKHFFVSLFDALDVTWINIFMVILITGSALNIGIRVPYFLINFKNTANKFHIHSHYNKTIYISLLTFIILLESIFIVNYNSINLHALFNSVTYLAIGSSMFLILLFVDKRLEIKLENKIDWIKIILFRYSKQLINRLFGVNYLFDGLYKISLSITNNLLSINYDKYFTIRSTIILSIMIFCLLFLTFIFSI